MNILVTLPSSMLIARKETKRYSPVQLDAEKPRMNAAFHDGKGMVAPFALFHVKPNSIDDYSILVWMPKICTKRIDSSEPVLLILLLLLLLSGRGALIRIDNLAHLLLVLALASVLVPCTSLPWA